MPSQLSSSPLHISSTAPSYGSQVCSTPSTQLSIVCSQKLTPQVVWPSPSSIPPTQSLSIPSHISSTPGFMSAFSSLHSLSSGVQYPSLSLSSVHSSVKSLSLYQGEKHTFSLTFAPSPLAFISLLQSSSSSPLGDVAPQ